MVQSSCGENKLLISHLLANLLANLAIFKTPKTPFSLSRVHNSYLTLEILYSIGSPALEKSLILCINFVWRVQHSDGTLVRQLTSDSFLVDKFCYPDVDFHGEGFV